jgi:excisionase family DNA binding protein
MSISFLTSLSEQEFKEFLKTAIQEVFGESLNGLKPESPELMNVDQAAEFLKLKPSTVYGKTSKKQIPHQRKGGKLYFNKTELLEWVKKGEVKTSDTIEAEAQTFLMKNKSR